MSSLISLLLLLALAFSASLALGRSLAVTLAPALLTAAALTYLFTYAGHKSYVVFALAGLVVLLCGVALLGRKTASRPSWGQLVSPGTLGFALLMAGCWPLVAPLRFALLDDLIHWGVFTKQLCFSQGFPNEATIATIYGDYPPGVQMLLTFLQIGRPFSHVGMFWGQLLWCFGLALPLLAGLAWGGGWVKNLAKVAGSALVLLCLPGLFNRFYTISLVVEPVMALLLGYALFTAWKARHRPGWFEIYSVALALVVLALAKSTGILYALFGAAAVLVLWAGGLRALGWPLRLAVCILPVALPLAGWQSWRVLCRALGNSSYFGQGATTAYTAENLWAFLQGKGLAGQVIPGFLKALAVAPLNDGIGPSALALVLGVWLAVWLLHRAGKGPGRAVLAALGLLSLLFVLYSASVCYSYVYLFDEWEAKSLSAFSRYIAPLPVAMLLLVLGPVGQALTGGKARRLALAGGGVALAVCAALPLSFWQGADYEAVSAIVPKRDYLAQQAYSGAAFATLGSSPQKVAVLSGQRATDRSSQLRRYFMLPHQLIEISTAQNGAPELVRRAWHTALEEQGYAYIWALPGGQEAAALVNQPLPHTLPPQGVVWPGNQPPPGAPGQAPQP